MPYILDDLIIDRVDFVDQGANSAAFIEVFKRKERSNPMDVTEILSKMKPEHAGVIQSALDETSNEVAKLRSDLETANQCIADKEAELAASNEELAKAKEALAKATETCECDGEAGEDGVCAVCGKPKKKAGFDETEVLKSLPEALREEFMKMRAQKEAAEEQVRKAAEEKAEAEAVAKAATLKSLPVAQNELVEILKGCDQRVVDLLTSTAEAIDNAVLGEVGKSAGNGAKTTDVSAWNKIEAMADEVMKRDNITKQKAISTVIKENPELYQEYLKGGVK